MLFLEMKLQNSLIVKQSDNKLTADINLSYAIGNKKLDQLENIIATLKITIPPTTYSGIEQQQNYYFDVFYKPV